jgi:hypothetical protein
MMDTRGGRVTSGLRLFSGNGSGRKSINPRSAEAEAQAVPRALTMSSPRVAVDMEKQ